jgi:hypothetical protein
MPCGLCLVFLVYIPLEGSTLKRVNEHKNFWQLSKSVEDVLAWILSNVYDPFKVVNQNRGSIHVNATIFDEQGKTDNITNGLRICL